MSVGQFFSEEANITHLVGTYKWACTTEEVPFLTSFIVLFRLESTVLPMSFLCHISCHDLYACYELSFSSWAHIPQIWDLLLCIGPWLIFLISSRCLQCGRLNWNSCSRHRERYFWSSTGVIQMRCLIAIQKCQINFIIKRVVWLITQVHTLLV